MDEARIRAATAADVPAIAEIVDQAYRHYIARMGKPPGPMLDDYAAHVSEGAVWVLEEGTAVVAIIVLLPAPIAASIPRPVWAGSPKTWCGPSSRRWPRAPASPRSGFSRPKRSLGAILNGLHRICCAQTRFRSYYELVNREAACA